MKKLLIAALFTCSLNSSAQVYEPTWESLDRRPVPDWFSQGKFGIFIHWGVYAVPAYTVKGNYSEWYQYQLRNKNFNGAVVDYHQKRFGPDVSYYDLAPQFKAELYQPDEWAKVIEQSGAKYVVLTSKHHDGYALWPSKEASSTWGFPWNAAEVGPKRDLLGELFTALRKTSVRPGMYYSLYEWFNPLWLNNRQRYVQEHMWPQMKDLINNYRPDVFWTDGEWDAPDTLWKSKEFLTWLFNESSVKNSIVVNDRWGSGIRFHHAGVYTPEYQPDLDFEDHAFEESRGMGYSYGYNREEDSWDYNSPQVMIIHLVDKVSRGGNFLLDIGPDAHGKIPPIMQERLLQIGRWMNANGEAIYNTRRWRTPVQWSEGRRDYKKPAHALVDDWKTGGDVALKQTVDPDPGYAVKECFFTYNPVSNDLYVHLPKWPSNNEFVITDLILKPETNIELLEGKRNVEWNQQGNNLVLKLPPVTPGYFKTDYMYVVKIGDAGKFIPKPSVKINYPENSSRPLISIVSEPQTVIHYTTDGTIPTEQSPVYTRTFSVEKNSTIKVKAFAEGVLPSDVVANDVLIYTWMSAVKPGKVKPGLNYQAYEIAATSVMELETATPVKEGIATSISNKYVTRNEHNGLRFSGFIRIPENGLYSFHLSSDDGSVLKINNQVIINNDGTHSNEEKTGSAALRTGYHKLELEYFNATGGAGLKLMMSSKGGMKTEVEHGMLFKK
jgi:alpha-L-fucosidase